MVFMEKHSIWPKPRKFKVIEILKLINHIGIILNENYKQKTFKENKLLNLESNKVLKIKMETFAWYEIFFDLTVNGIKIAQEIMMKIIFNAKAN